MEAILGPRKIVQIEAVAYFLIIVGTLGDHLSTMFALTRQYIYEANPVALRLMVEGLWLPVDAVLIIVGITVPYFLIRRIKNPALKGLLAYPMVFGIVRLIACFWNLGLAL